MLDPRVGMKIYDNVWYLRHRLEPEEAADILAGMGVTYVMAQSKTLPMQDTAIESEVKKIAPQVGGSFAFRMFIRKELMPEVRARYRTTDETAIVGESLAGLNAFQRVRRAAPESRR